MDFDFPSTEVATLPRDSNDVLLIQQNHADWQPIIGFVTQRSAIRMQFPATAMTLGARFGTRRSAHNLQRCLMKLPACSSDIACRSSSCVFITMGPYQATGSSIGLPETSKNRMPSSPA